MKPPRLLRRLAYPQRLSGPILEAALPDVSIGELCEIRRSWQDREVVARAQVVGFQQERAVLSLIGNARGLSREAVLQPTGRALSAWIGDAALGAMLDPTGQVVERFASQPAGHAGGERGIDVDPPPYSQRVGVREPLVTGVRVIDGLLTCGIGQRVGIFASAGCGKTMLMHMLIDQAEADVFVIGLIGERGREVTEFAESLRQSPKRDRCVLVYATSDYASVDRCNAALLATTVAEYFRDQGKRVVLFVDSMTRYARALRDVALAAGEPPARRGYPASVFDSLPRLLERPGATREGSITAFYTVLLEGDDEPDPMADEIRSILDGHIYLSRKLAGQGHYPAVDVLKSASRVAGQVCADAHLQAASGVRGLMARLEELQVFIDLGEYRQGENADNDRAMQAREALRQWLRQPLAQNSPFDSTLRGMHELIA
ncbi:type III secretion system ATPase SctN [Chromobacterium piscinae]|uniref:type III secretion system ATPase SctN n=1 Tax=Chromobacterium piscinae TaxID=686831 RepID=UPI0014099EE7|nr:type III secretion system ATPase SctN [Chromobacterium piscinae]MBX9346853.1 type III secretion system ATPase SctN [Chromobacterium vaccinii]MCD4505107.1 type III secretion system ATPase SctN [Chromobacterium piscinae]MCD5328710.1 type III secretion system ATPase SctN [Chromobacterium piscinae]NHQ83114.1 FliI/YscN family ATPase [Chromobacterium vaccinii]